MLRNCDPDAEDDCGMDDAGSCDDIGIEEIEEL